MDLIRAAESGDIQSVHELLDRGADPNSSDRHGTTALMRASDDDFTECSHV